ncbi:YceH family protein [Desulfococcus sp.]|uniref:YceH family protein n=1 Tax=Desulfococcus sp. TaxID=2025834 RepID=UPI0035933CF3
MEKQTDVPLDPVEVRILGVLIEKQMATPDYYPLSLNAMCNACNQRSNREPVMNLDEASVQQAVDRLRNRRLVWQIRTHGSRIAKYRHNLEDVADFSDRELAVLCVLFLRGPQTAGELRQRTVRLAEFHALPAVEHTLQKLAGREEGPFAVQLARRPGQKESRWAHLFAAVEETDAVFDPSAATEEIVLPESGDPVRDPSPVPGRLEILETRVAELETELSDLKAAFLAFRTQFE